jgi:cytochrome oxidase Cu insertion factor (SCO1/SenC/PrrC family)
MPAAIRFGLTLGLSVGLFLGAAGAHEGHKPAPGSGASADYAFPIAAPGSYALPPIKRAAGGAVLDDEGRRHDLGDLLRGRTSVLAFIYTRCGDVCPTATHDLSRLQDMAARDRRLARQVRLVTMSFDPEHDTPSIMRAHAQHWRSADRAAPEWLFLTAPDGDSLAPVLAGYNQSVAPKTDAAGTDGFHHIFRAFLVDSEGRIRNIYSLDFFDPALVLNDIRTLLLEADRRPRRGPGSP